VKERQRERERERERERTRLYRGPRSSRHVAVDVSDSGRSSVDKYSVDKYRVDFVLGVTV